jgi:hypothetical protein
MGLEEKLLLLYSEWDSRPTYVPNALLFGSRDVTKTSFLALLGELFFLHLHR